MVEAGAWCTFKDLYEAYQAWGAESGEPTETKRRFGNRLTARSFEKDNGTANVAIRRGLALLHVGGTGL